MWNELQRIKEHSYGNRVLNELPTLKRVLCVHRVQRDVVGVEESVFGLCLHHVRFALKRSFNGLGDISATPWRTN